MPGKRTNQTNITREHRRQFEALTSGEYSNFALFSCFVNGEPSVAIVAIEKDGTESKITPLFVAVTREMKLENHYGARPGVDGGKR